MDLDDWRRSGRPVTLFRMPHNFRDELYNEGEGPSFCHYADGEERRPAPISGAWGDLPILPIPMPSCLMMFTDADGKVIAATADGKQIRWRDLDIVVTAVEQYNEDCARLGITERPPSLLEDENDGEPPDAA